MHSKLLVLGTAVLLVGCGGSDARESRGDAATAPNVVTVRAGDYFFEAPDTVAAGMTTFRMETSGQEMHHLQAVMLMEGRTVADLMAHLTGDAHGIPEWAHLVGGPNAPAPGETYEATLDLRPGNYALICMIPSPDGAPHIMKGMFRPLTVTPSAQASAPAPEADLVMSLTDYDFEMAPMLSAGRRTIKVENVAEQPHEVFIARLAPGKTLEDFMGWLEKMEGPPPAKPMGGTTLIAQGEANYITGDFEPGEYALICFVPDAGDGRPHFMHGMMRQIRVG
jgi:uncharacterized cupredoxin-like copper-binding protein